MMVLFTFFKNKELVKRVFLLIGIVLITSCSSGRQSFEKGDYDRAVFQAVNRLQKEPGNKKALATLKQAYTYAAENHQNRIKESTNSSDIFRWEAIIAEYEQLNDLIEAVRKCPTYRQVVGAESKFSEQLATARQKAAEARYAEGIKRLQEPNRQNAKEAYLHFEQADQFIPSYKDIRQKLDEAYEAALLKVVIEPVEVNKGTYQLSNEYFQNKIFEYLQHYESKSFIKFYTPHQARSEKFVPDHILTLKFDDFVVGQTYLKEKEREVKRDSVKTGTIDGKDVYGTVKAKYITFEKTITSSGLLDFKVIDWKTKDVITHEKMPGTFVWQDAWATYKGDERALTKENKKMVNRRQLPEPGPQFLFVEFTKPIYNQLTAKIERFYKNY